MAAQGLRFEAALLAMALAGCAGTGSGDGGGPADGAKAPPPWADSRPATPVARPKPAPAPAAPAAVAPPAPPARPKPAPRQAPQPEWNKAHVFPDVPPPIDKSALPGDGQPFPLVVEFVNATTHEPLPGFLSERWYLWDCHPKSPDHIELTEFTHADGIARIDFPRFPPAHWGFTRDEPNLNKIDVDAWIAIAPPGNRFTVEIPEFTLHGIVVGPDDAPLALRKITLTGHGLQVQSNSPESVRYVSLEAESCSDHDGTFTIQGLIPGNYLVEFQGIDLVHGQQVPNTFRRVVPLGPAMGELRLGPLPDKEQH